MLTVKIVYTGENQQIEWTSAKRVAVDKANGALIVEDSYGIRIVTATAWQEFTVGEG